MLAILGSGENQKDSVPIPAPADRNAQAAFGGDCSMPAFRYWQMATYTKLHKVVQERNF
jgi:hypothetical protein